MPNSQTENCDREPETKKRTKLLSRTEVKKKKKIKNSVNEFDTLKSLRENEGHLSGSVKLSVQFLISAQVISGLWD